jgi:hypothetical protein
MDVIAQEREWERQRKFFEATERAADYRAGIIAAQILNAVGGEKFWEPDRLLPAPQSGRGATDATPRESHEDRVRRFLKEGVIPQDDDSAESVRFLREGFQGMKEKMLANAAL